MIDQAAINSGFDFLMIGHEANASEAEKQHCPGGGFGHRGRHCSTRNRHAIESKTGLKLVVQDVGDTEHKLVSQVMVILNSINRFDPSSVAATGAETLSGVTAEWRPTRPNGWI